MTSKASATRIWLLPLSLIGGASFALLGLTFALDAPVGAGPLEILARIRHPHPDAAVDTLANAGEIVAGVLAIALTVVAIVVELASNRYTHRVTELFVSEPVNVCVMALFVVTAVHGVWVTLTFDHHPGGSGFVPYVGVMTSMALLTLCLLVLLPYFNFVFAYLNPLQIVRRIHTHTAAAIARGGDDVEGVQREAVRGIEQLGDVALNAMQHRDTGVSMAAVDALADLLRDHQRIRSKLPEAFFRVGGELAHNPDFVSMDKSVLADVSARRIWVEMKILRQYQMVFGEALGRIREVSSLIAIDTRRLAEEASHGDRPELLALGIKFFNTYLRAAINQQDVRTAYTVAHQYRMLAQALLERGDREHALQISRHFLYYAQVCHTAQLPFVVETLAYDLCSLNEAAHERSSPLCDDLLDIFLRVDEETHDDAHLRGVRKAQVKLATYYMAHADEPRARSIFHDMRGEARDRLVSLRDELRAVESPEYWEITDRGANFDYLPPERKQRMEEFFGWFETLG
jgi:hypothetical protein